MQRMLQSRALVGTLFVAAALALAGCATNAGSGGSDAEPSDPVGAWGDTTTQTEPSLVLAEDGILNGTDGCNRLRGSWSADGETIIFNQVASTRMACDGVDTWLSGLATATISGAEMTVLDASGTEIGTLTRSE